MQAKFITLEGVEGVGKTSNLAFVKSYLESLDISVLVTREPGGTELSEEIRDLLLRPRAEPVAEMTELLLIFAARAQHVENVILPALQRGTWVLCDRFVDATFAYQGGGRGLSIESIEKLETLVLQGLKPDLTLLLDLPVEQGIERALARAALDRFEQEKQEFFQSVRAAYLARAKQEPKRLKIIDAAPAIAEVQRSIAAVLQAEGIC